MKTPTVGGPGQSRPPAPPKPATGFGDILRGELEKLGVQEIPRPEPSSFEYETGFDPVPPPPPPPPPPQESEPIGMGRPSEFARR